MSEASNLKRMKVASNSSASHQSPTPSPANARNSRALGGSRTRPHLASPTFASLLVLAASGCGGRTIDDENGTVTGALTTTAAQEVDAGAELATTSNPQGVPDTAAGSGTSAAPTDSTFTGRCEQIPNTGSTDSRSSAGSTAAVTDTAVTSGTTSPAVSGFTSASVGPVSSTTVPAGSTSGNSGSVTAGCSTNWCWEDPVAAGDTFYEISRDGTYASATHGVVFAWPDTYLPSAPTGASGFVEASGTDVWLGNSDGLFRYDGREWTRATTTTVLGLSQSAGGATWALFDSEQAPLQRLVDGQWVPEPMPDGSRGLDLIAVDGDTVWVVAGTVASHWRDGIHTGELTLYEVTAGNATVISNATGTLLAAPRFSHVGERIYVHDDGGLTQEVYDPLDWLVDAVKPANALGLHGTPEGRLLTNDWPELATFNERGSERVYGQLCSDLETLDPDSMLCAAFYGGLVRLSRRVR